MLGSDICICVFCDEECSKLSVWCFALYIYQTAEVRFKMKHLLGIFQGKIYKLEQPSQLFSFMPNGLHAVLFVV